MAKIRYHFNPESFTVEQVKLTFGDRLKRSIIAMISGMVFSALLLFVAYTFFASPKERMMQREIEQMELQYAILSDRMEVAQHVLDDLRDRDDNIYRIIFEAEPVSIAERKAGYGGVDRYARLDGYERSGMMISATKKMDQITSQLYVQSKSFDEVYELARKKEQMLRCIPAIQPIRDNDIRRISSYFGYRTDPFYKIRKFHEGVDFSAPMGKEVVATADGKVIDVVRSRRGYGNTVIIDHGYSYKTIYGHLNSFKVVEGQQVVRGQVIATVGNSGKSTAPHLHYEIRKNNTPVNPIHFFYNDLTPEQYELILELSLSPTQSMD
ncbi:MAG: M23 family metallopeptidase [Bacteroidia bacterium]|nr:M23 family metallopeptidase [Bacteroidia bacterium]